ncbi:hypothetical protein [Bradyrhizobium sp. CB3481]|uniref:hypothetical protein n=1 Tax=Bradyrhizobium sp. CB3481 TaxID=3039158 RepID=UPI0024B1822C|nr:hypothetical protein [Bradyrhizobium sp. CB3481]WFU14417.1 hypothetical protein QA643_24890 [Bradyrhizobium sp. CB3481]
MQAFFFVLLMFAGFVAYWLRCRHRFSYGILEIIAAVGLMIIAVFHPEAGHLSLGNGSVFGEVLSSALSFIASVYLMVRGLDNMDNDLPLSWRSRWDRLFPKPAAKPSVQSADQSAAI